MVVDSAITYIKLISVDIYVIKQINAKNKIKKNHEGNPGSVSLDLKK